MAQISGSVKNIRCAAKPCRVVVESFHFPTGSVSTFGIQLADSLSAQLAKTSSDIAVVNRQLLQHRLDQERLNPLTISDPRIGRWLARTVMADAILIGEISKTGSDSISLTARLLKADDSKAKELSIKATFQVDTSKMDFGDIRRPPNLPQVGDTFEGEALYRSDPGLLPSCFYMPNPPYTEDAKRAGAQGIILLEGIIKTAGHIVQLRVVNGLPFGLNESALHTVQTWRCKAAQRDGKPVPVLVPFEVSFHLNPN